MNLFIILSLIQIRSKFRPKTGRGGFFVNRQPDLYYSGPGLRYLQVIMRNDTGIIAAGNRCKMPASPGKSGLPYLCRQLTWLYEIRVKNN